MIGNLNVLDAWDCFSDTFNRLLQQTVPIVASAKRRNKNIYITHETKSLKNKRNHMWRKYTRSCSESDFRAYSGTRNVLRTLTRNLRRNFERRVANNVKQNPKVFWSYVKVG